MPNNIRANIETGAQIIIAIAVVIVAGVVVMRYLYPPQVNGGSMQQEAQMLVGTQISVPNVDWQQNQKSLIFFLKKDCAFCKTSAPFYRQVIEEAQQRNVKWLTILPDPLDVGREYVQSLELPIENIQSASLSSYKVPGTPALLFVNNQGKVMGAWVGAPKGRETEMRAELIALFDGKR